MILQLRVYVLLAPSVKTLLLSGLTLTGSYEALENLEPYLGDGPEIKTHHANDG